MTFLPETHHPRPIRLWQTSINKDPFLSSHYLYYILSHRKITSQLLLITNPLSSYPLLLSVITHVNGHIWFLKLDIHEPNDFMTWWTYWIGGRKDALGVYRSPGMLPDIGPWRWKLPMVKNCRKKLKFFAWKYLLESTERVLGEEFRTWV